MKKIFKWLSHLWIGSQKLIERYVRPSVEVVQLFKVVMDSPVMPVLTAIIPGNIDNVIAAKIKLLLPNILIVLGYADECVHSGSGDTVFKCAIAKLRLMDDSGRNAAFHSIASLLSECLSDGRLTWREALHLAEEVFQQLKTK